MTLSTISLAGLASCPLQPCLVTFIPASLILHTIRSKQQYGAHLQDNTHQSVRTQLVVVDTMTKLRSFGQQMTA